MSEATLTRHPLGKACFFFLLRDWLMEDAVGVASPYTMSVALFSTQNVLPPARPRPFPTY